MSDDPSPPTSGRSVSISKQAKPVALGREGVAALLNLSLSSIDRMNGAGQLPQPHKLGGSLRWNARELVAWLDHGSPDRKTWAPIWAAMVRARRTGRGR